MPELIYFQVDPATNVRKFLLTFLEGAVLSNPDPLSVQHATTCITALIADETAAVAKDALSTAIVIIKTSLALVMLHPEEPSSPPLWEATKSLIRTVTSTINNTNKAESTKAAAIKTAEHIVMMYSSNKLEPVKGVLESAAMAMPAGPSSSQANGSPTKAALVKEAEHILTTLTSIVKHKGTSSTDGVKASVMGAAIQAVATIAQQRSQFLAKTMPCLIALTKKKKPSTGNADKDKDEGAVLSSTASKALIKGLTGILKSGHAKAWRKKVMDALRALGVEVEEDGHEHEDQPQQQIRLEEGRGRGAQPAQDPRQRPHHHHHHQQQQPSDPRLQKRPQRHLQQQQQQQQQQPEAEPAKRQRLTDGSHLPHHPHHPPPPPRPMISVAATNKKYHPLLLTPVEQLNQVQTVAETLIANNDANTLVKVINGLHTTVLVDVVLNNLQNLPISRHVLPSDSSQIEPWIEAMIKQLQGPITLVGQPALVAAPPSQLQQQQQGVGKKTTLPPAPVVTLSREPVQKVDPETPIILNEAEVAALKLDAVLRILKTEKTAAPQLRSNLVARLVAMAVDDDSLGDAVLQYLLQDFHGRGGMVLAMRWLHLLFLEQCSILQAQASGREEDGAMEEEEEEEKEEGDEQEKKQQYGGVIEQLPPDVTGSRYELVLTALLEGLREALPPSDRTLITVLLEVPALPMPSTRQFLQDICSSNGPEWSTLGLLAAKDLILQRPPVRDEVLALTLEASVSKDDDTRSKAVRLIANRLFPLPYASMQIEEFAKATLESLLEVEDAKEDDEKINGVEGGGDQAMTEAEQGDQATKRQREQQEKEQEIRAKCSLYCALCTKKHSLLKGLFQTYGKANSQIVKAAISSNSPGLAKTLGVSAPSLLTVVTDPPEGSFDLVVNMVEVLTDSIVPPPLLVAACLQLFEKTQNPKILPAVLPGMDKTAVLRMLPKVLGLSSEGLRSAVGRLTIPLQALKEEGVGAGSSTTTTTPIGAPTPALFDAAEILAALLLIDHEGDKELLKRMVAALTVFINSPDLFPPEALAAAINQLMTRVPLPALFMRAVIQTLAAAPRLKAFIVNILTQLVTKQIWLQDTQWRGWILCAEQAAPESYVAWLQLPGDVLSGALQSTRKGFREKLAEYTLSSECSVPVGRATREVLRQVGGKD